MFWCAACSSVSSNAINRINHLPLSPVPCQSSIQYNEWPTKLSEEIPFSRKKNQMPAPRAPSSFLLYNHLIDLKIKWMKYTVLTGARNIVCWSCLLIGLPGAARRSDYFLIICSGIRLYSHDLWDAGHRTNGVNEKNFHGKRGTVAEGDHLWSTRRWCDLILSFTEHVWRGDRATSRLSNPLFRLLIPSNKFDALNPTSPMKTTAALNWFQQVT